MALAANRTKTESAAANPQSAPQKGSTTVFQGAIVCLDSSGYAKPGVTGTGLIGVGRAIEYSANAGSDGDKKVTYEEGVFGPYANGSTSIAVGDEGKPCYIVDDETVHLTSNSGARSPAGRIHSVTSAGVWVYMSKAIGRQIAAMDALVSGVTFAQTYSTADTTIAAATTHAITDSTGGSASTTALASMTGVDGAGSNAAPLTATRNNIATLGAELALTQADLLQLKKNVNKIVDVIQAVGIAG